MFLISEYEVLTATFWSTTLMIVTEIGRTNNIICRNYDFKSNFTFFDRASLYNLFHMKPTRCTILLSVFI